MAEPPPLGLLGEFGSPERLVEAARLAREAGVCGLDAYTPFPVDGLAEALALREARIPWLAAIGAVAGLIGAYALQIGTNLDYRLNVGGRPLLPLQAFALIGFELLVLGAVLFIVTGFFALNRLPRYHHPLFWVDRFERATRDGFFLFVPTADAETVEAARVLFARLAPESLDEVPR